ncbi:NADH dehydrogenase [ubiquinone] flavoprotein 3, mitochondrial [Amphibalanus amphitrite]|uniref:NADH dehydrogenase [ubiquinone] flavoprotein 3, mitochondrial n=1 Tax=Amphibalanus amphitrite TaxID=1232801 RepID=A0A6A4W8X7_AMPAM|nr:NADH dehydrogenase [ubiquinone] flavoprotein 3, mitochondrial [Amphibalanus amphitrite]
MFAARLSSRHIQLASCRLMSGQTQPPAPASKGAASPPPADDTPVGPGASKAGTYKNPEYYRYNPMSYFDLELDMKKDRLPQPNSRK